MSALDIFVILLLGGAAIIGFVRGFAHEVLALFAWIVAILALSLEEFQARIARGATELKREPPTELTMTGWWEQAKTLEEE